jgi:hypothetical protein
MVIGIAHLKPSLARITGILHLTLINPTPDEFHRRYLLVSGRDPDLSADRKGGLAASALGVLLSADPPAPVILSHG